MTNEEEKVILVGLSEGWRLAQERLSLELSKH
jgi:hypothetical protein